MKEIHLEEIKGNDKNTYRIRIFEGDKKLTAALNIVTVLNGQENEDSVKVKDYPINTMMLEILEEAHLGKLMDKIIRAEKMPRNEQLTYKLPIT